LLEKFFIKPEEALLVIIDVQEKLSRAMEEEILEKVVNNCLHLIQLAKLYRIPIILTEQYPKGLGPTLEEIRAELPVYEPVEKLSFSVMGEEAFVQRLEGVNKKKVILTGMETHVCVWQSCLDLLHRGYHVFIPRDAVCSRKKEDYKAGLSLMAAAGGVVTSTEALLFQMLERADTEEFKVIQKRLK